MTDIFELPADEHDFPTALFHCHPPVKTLYARGSPGLFRSLAKTPGVAIVGSRQASAQGLADARRFALAISEAGIAVVSGLALGIDAAAHESAMAAEGKTVAVLGHGPDKVYPPAHHALAEKIVSGGGLLLGEYPRGVGARPFHFPHRNRIIAALSRAILVIEATPQSGSLITARHGLDLGIDVFALPGSIHSPQSLGTNALIRQGAQLVQSPEQFLEDLGLSVADRGAFGHGTQLALAPSDERSRKVLDCLGFAPLPPEDLCKKARLTPGDVYAGLLLLELSGQAKRLPDGRWLRYRCF